MDFQRDFPAVALSVWLCGSALSAVFALKLGFRCTGVLLLALLGPLSALLLGFILLVAKDEF